jgi:prolyl-tRNA synthetase
MRTRLFLRTAEFFMARRAYCSCHKSRGCGRVRKMMNVYADFAENFMAIPVKGIKNRNRTLCWG